MGAARDDGGSFAADGRSLAQQVSSAPPDDRLRILLDLVLAQTADLLGEEASSIDPERAYSEYGANSLAAVELTTQLGEACELELPLTLLFDHPNPLAVARHLLALLEPEDEAPPLEPAPARPHARASEGEDDPIAIVGLACRLPGGIDTPAELWRLVSEGRDVVGAFPADRGWPLESLFHSDPDHPGTSYVRSGGFLSEATEFDPEFFGIGPREAVAMDPQQRLFLEGAWEVFEDAGIDPAKVRGTPTGVFAGVSSTDYSLLARYGGSALEGYWGLGSVPSVVSGRVAYVFGLEGPALTVDTACSSSLVAVHLAVQSLRRGECGLAVAGGVTVLSTPSVFVEFSRQRALSPDGRCRSFAGSADGTGWSEGMGVLLLERLSDARRCGHRVLALLRGSAVNQDGASNGLTAPNGPSQERVIRAALVDAGLVAGDVDVVEGHGTATVLGDPIEAQALLGVYGVGRSVGAPLWLGSLKSNVGHTQAAAGVGGVIKMVMALREGVLPATLHVDEPTSKVDWSGGGVRLLTESREWVRGGGARRAGVSGFGASGTNAHVILEEAPCEVVGGGVVGGGVEGEGVVGERGVGGGFVGEGGGGLVVCVVSGKMPSGLAAQARRLREWVGAHPEQGLLDVGYSLASTRAHLSHRAVLLAGDRAQLLDQLQQLGADPPARAASARTARVAFVFPGQGTQWVGMARGLLKSSPVFAERLQACARALDPHLDWSLLDVLREDSEPLERVDVAQVSLFAIMVALAEMWRSYGVEPDAVVGHSQGEIAAACVAGALSLEDAARIVALRGRQLATLGSEGTMLSVAESRDSVRARLASLTRSATIAAVNSPSSTILSGEREALNELYEDCVADGVWTRWVPVGYASHSPQVARIRDTLTAILEPVRPRSSTTRFQSTVTGGRLDTLTLDASYWYSNLRQPVLFHDAVRDLIDQGYGTFIEVSPHTVLTAAILQTAESMAAEVVVTGSLGREKGELADFQASVGEAWAGGVAIDWTAAFAGSGARRVELPRYAFNRRRFWAQEGVGARDPHASGFAAERHPILAAHVHLAAGGGDLFTGRLSVQQQPWLTEHTVFERIVVPGTALLELTSSAAARLDFAVVDELTLQAPVLVPPDGVGIQLQVGEPRADGRAPFTIHTEDGAGGWLQNGSGALASAPAEPAATAAAPSGNGERGALIAPAELYQRLDDRGLGYGPTFRGLRSARRAGAEVHADVALGGDGGGAEDACYQVHPALLDAAFHAAFADAEGHDSALLPFSWSGVRIRPRTRPPRNLRVRLTPAGEDAVRMLAYDDEDALVVSVDSVLVRPVSAGALVAGGLYGVDWRHAPSAGPTVAREALTILAEDTPVRGSESSAGWLVVPLLSPPAGGFHDASKRLLALLQQWLGSERAPGARMVVVTSSAVAAQDGDLPTPELAALWGLARSAQTEHPGAIVLVDLEGGELDVGQLGAALAVGEPQVAVRRGAVLVPRVRPRRAAPQRQLCEPEETVLITGGLSGLGALLARHLVVAHGARRLLLVSRRGLAAEGAAALVEELSELGAHVEVVACDVSDRDALARVLDAVDSRHPLRAVVHSAGVLDDALIDSMTAEQLERVLFAKADAAWHLHELTAEHELTSFVLFSSLAGVVGGLGQGNYAAANAFLDSLAQLRRCQGCPALSIAWGPWEQPGDMTVGLSADDATRLARSGALLLSTQDGLRLFDAALGSLEALVLAARLDTAALRRQAAGGGGSPLLSELAPAAAAHPVQEAAGLIAELAGAPAAERDGRLLRLVRSAAASVLQHTDLDAVPADSAFTDLGFDSLGAVELRNSLSAVTGLVLPVTVVFDHPTPRALATLLSLQLWPAAAAETDGPRADAFDPTEGVDEMDAETLVELVMRGT